MTRAFAAASVVALLSTAPLGAAQAPQIQRPGTDPLPVGQRIVARDGDVVVVEDDARVKIVRRREANVRVVYNAAQHWVVVLADYLSDGGDGLVDTTYTFNGITGDWPLDARWEGTVTLEDYLAPGEFGPQSFGLITPRGLVQIVSQPSWLKDPTAIAVLTNRGAGRSSGPRTSFDEAEERGVDTATRAAERNGSPVGAGGVGGVMTMEGISNPPGSAANYPAPQAPGRLPRWQTRASG